MSTLGTGVRRRNLHNPKRASKNYLYTPEEVRELYDICENTLSSWVKHDLPYYKLGRKRLYKGEHLNSFHQKRLDDSRKPAGDNEVRCFACRCNHSLLDSPLIYDRGPRSVMVWGTCPESEYRPNKILSTSQFEALLKRLNLNPSTEKGE